MNKSARERIGRQDLSRKVPSKKESLGVIFSPRNYRENTHSKSANFDGRHSGGHCSAGPFCLLPKMFDPWPPGRETRAVTGKIVYVYVRFNLGQRRRLFRARPVQAGRGIRDCWTGGSLWARNRKKKNGEKSLPGASGSGSAKEYPRKSSATNVPKSEIRLKILVGISARTNQKKTPPPPPSHRHLPPPVLPPPEQKTKKKHIRNVRRVFFRNVGRGDSLRSLRNDNIILDNKILHFQNNIVMPFS